MTITMCADEALTLETAQGIVTHAWGALAEHHGWPDGLAAPTCGELCAFLQGNGEHVERAFAEHERRLKDCIAAIDLGKWRELVKRLDAVRNHFLVDPDLNRPGFPGEWFA